ncbi:hypothetical protein CEXT_316261 [Caerostris extrusa]|uniref:Uncharacterized protein n=1 Tax=Caerostris extrusa TaxID=172846 RepID=A0AAV4QDN5_CAEEX|nr:hypothetical protein CEXT_316261 [Caerostris extrusa]
MLRVGHCSYVTGFLFLTDISISERKEKQVLVFFRKGLLNSDSFVKALEEASCVVNMSGKEGEMYLCSCYFAREILMSGSVTEICCLKGNVSMDEWDKKR